jgi:diacylglycerol kinase (ATP)
MRVLVVHNPSSGAQNSDIHEFVRSAMKPGDEFVLRQTASIEDVLPMTRDIADFDAIVASGGDGTISRVAYAIRESGKPLLAYPSGTANIFVVNLNNAEEPAAMASMLRTGRLASFDMGELAYRDSKGSEHRQGFLMMAGAGFDASIMKSSEDLKPMFGQMSYYLSALGNPHPTRASLHIKLDGEPLEAEGICVLVGGWGSVNPNFLLIPGTDPQDGLLDVAVVTTPHAVQLIPPVIGSIMKGGKGVIDPTVEVKHCRKIELSCDPQLPMQFDGEVIEDALTPFTIRILPGALTTFVDSLSPFYENARPLDADATK